MGKNDGVNDKTLCFCSVSGINERLLTDEINKWVENDNESALLANLIDAIALPEESKQDNWDNFIGNPRTGVCLLCKSIVKVVLQNYHRGVSAGSNIIFLKSD